jgi:hypothetical protein
MKKIFFWILLFLCACLLYSVSTKLIFDFDRLTNYGVGYIVGQVILLIIFGLFAILLKRKKVALQGPLGPKAL